MFEFFQYDFMLRALLSGIAIAVVCPVIGSFLILKRLTLIGEGLGHASFAGVAIGWLLGSYPVVTAALVAGLVAVGIEKLRSLKLAQGDVAIAIFLYSGLSLGIILAGLAPSGRVDLTSYLFGSIVTVSEQDLWIITLLVSFVVGTTGLLYRYLFLIVLDEESAQAAGIPVRRINLIFIILTAMTIAAAIRVVGVLLVSALMIIPVSTGMHLSKSFRGMIVTGIVTALVAVLGGLWASFEYSLAPGGTIVLIAVITYFTVTGINLGVLSIRKKALLKEQTKGL